MTYNGIVYDHLGGQHTTIIRACNYDRTNSITTCIMTLAIITILIVIVMIILILVIALI